MTNTSTPENIHHGRNLKRLREMLGIKQEALAVSLGEEWSQKKVSRLEDQKIIEEDVLQEVSKALQITPEAIKNFDEQAVINIISNTFQDFKDNAIANANHCTFNPIDKIVQLYDEKIELYERMLKEKNEMIARLESLINQPR